MAGFTFDAYIKRVVDGDTAIVHPQVYRPLTDLYVRFKDVWADELGNTKGEEQKAAAQAAFPEGSRVTCQNEAIQWSFERLVARVDKA